MIPFWTNPQGAGKQPMLISGYAARPHSGGVERSTRRARPAGALLFSESCSALAGSLSATWTNSSFPQCPFLRPCCRDALTAVVGAAIAGAIAAVVR
jgi:hypothetical protein